MSAARDLDRKSSGDLNAVDAAFADFGRPAVEFVHSKSAAKPTVATSWKGGLVLFQAAMLAISATAAGFWMYESWGPSPSLSSPVAPAAVKTKPIEEICVGDRVLGRNPLPAEAEAFEPDPATWQKIRLRMEKPSGAGLWIELLRPEAWFAAADPRVGGSIELEMHEMGAVGPAEVLAIEPCPAIQPGEGTVVTGTFKHQADENTEVVHLKLEDQVELTGVTANHPYWSEDRQDFVEAGDLRAGELVDTESGLKHVVSVTPIEHDGFLYNLETTEHVLRVGSLGTLVHNFCVHRITPDAQGRVRSALAHITPADLGTGTATNSATRATARALGNSTDDAGHLIGRLLGGPGGKRSENFFAQNPHINRGAFRDMEGQVADLVRNGHDVWLRVTPKYSGAATRPFELQVQIRVDGVTQPLLMFPN